jgi:hypothetical protein
MVRPQRGSQGAWSNYKDPRTERADHAIGRSRGGLTGALTPRQHPDLDTMIHQTRACRAQKMALQGLVIAVIRALLRTPLLCRAVGKRLITVYVIGRKVRTTLRRPGRLRPPRRDHPDRNGVRLGTQSAHRRAGGYPVGGQEAPRRRAGCPPARPASSSTTPPWPATTISGPGSTGSPSTRPVTPIPTIFTSPGPQEAEPSCSHRSEEPQSPITGVDHEGQCRRHPAPSRRRPVGSVELHYGAVGSAKWVIVFPLSGPPW